MERGIGIEATYGCRAAGGAIEVCDGAAVAGIVRRDAGVEDATKLDVERGVAADVGDAVVPADVELDLGRSARRWASVEAGQPGLGEVADAGAVRRELEGVDRQSIARDDAGLGPADGRAEIRRRKVAVRHDIGSDDVNAVQVDDRGVVHRHHGDRGHGRSGCETSRVDRREGERSAARCRVLRGVLVANAADQLIEIDLRDRCCSAGVVGDRERLGRHVVGNRDSGAAKVRSLRAGGCEIERLAGDHDLLGRSVGIAGGDDSERDQVAFGDVVDIGQRRAGDLHRRVTLRERHGVATRRIGDSRGGIEVHQRLVVHRHDFDRGNGDIGVERAVVDDDRHVPVHGIGIFRDVGECHRADRCLVVRKRCRARERDRMCHRIVGGCRDARRHRAGSEEIASGRVRQRDDGGLDRRVVRIGHAVGHGRNWDRRAVLGEGHDIGGIRGTQFNMRRVVDRGHFDVDSCSRCQARWVRDRIGEFGRTIVVGRRQEGERQSIGRQTHRSVCGGDRGAAGRDRLAFDVRNVDRIAIDIVVVGQRRQRNGGVFRCDVGTDGAGCRCEVIIDSDRRVVDARDGDRQRRCARTALRGDNTTAHDDIDTGVVENLGNRVARRERLDGRQRGVEDIAVRSIRIDG